MNMSYIDEFVSVSQDNNEIVLHYIYFCKKNNKKKRSFKRYYVGVTFSTEMGLIFLWVFWKETLIAQNSKYKLIEYQRILSWINGAAAS